MAIEIAASYVCGPFKDAIWSDIVAVAVCPKVAELGIGDGMKLRFILDAPSAKVR